MRPRRIHTLWPAYVVLAAGLTVTAAASSYVKDSTRREEQDRFYSTANLVHQALTGEAARYIDLLTAARAYLESATEVTRADWRGFCKSVNLDTHYPGALALGFAPLIPRDALEPYQQAVRQQGLLDYKVWPPGDRDGYTPIEYIEPLDRVNRAAVGFDMSSEPDRHDAMNRAMLQNQPVATARTRLVQNSTDHPLAGFLIYLPVYRKNQPTDTPEQRAAALAGFVYSPYLVTRLVNAILSAHEDLQLVDFQLYDGPAAAPNALLYDSRFTDAPLDDLNPQAFPPLPATGLSTTLTVGMRPWTLLIAPSPKLTRTADHNRAWLVLLGGALISWLLFGLSWLQMRARAQSELAASRIAASEQLLRESELRYRLKIEQSPMAVQTFSPDGQTLSINSAWESLWALSFPDLAGYNILHDPELERHGLLDGVRAAFTGKTVSVGPIFYDAPALPSGKKPRPRWVRLVLYPIRDVAGGIREVVLIHHDVTERIEAEQALQLAKEAAENANHAKDQFLAVLSHELRNPLAPVLSMVNLLQEKSLPPDEAAGAIETIRRNVELEARLIDDLLDITRISRGKMHLDIRTVDAHTILRHALQICEEDIAAKSLRVDLHLNAQRSLVEADPARLQQVCWNLIKNAVKFTPNAGRITITTRNLPAPTEPSTERLEIAVADSGIGIEPEKLPHIFDAFEQADRSITRRFGGLGLGLAITKALVEAHHGEIEARSPGPKQGATFSLWIPTAPAGATLPAPRPERPAPAAPNPAAPSRSGPLRILVVEDQPDARRGLRALLQHHGYSVQTAATAAEALDIARAWPYDLLISDIGLPDQSGFDLAPQLLALHATPAIALTGFGMEQDIQRARDAGFHHHLTKPIHFDRLEHAIHSLTNPA